jgi:hypothetical protein
MGSSMTDPGANAELLSSLGRLVRGLSALFWGLPITLVVGVQTTRGEWLRSAGILPPLLATGMLLYGLCLLARFRSRERIWHKALDRARIFALVNLGLSPFLYWWNILPADPFFNTIVELIMISGLLFLLFLNPVLCRLAAMLPDETLRQETRLFTHINQCILFVTLLLAVAYYLLVNVHPLPPYLVQCLNLLNRFGLWLVLFLVLMPVAMTMAMIWKIKEIILSSVFTQ